jgi:VWFA-related protein
MVIVFAACGPLFGQAPAGPQTPAPGTPMQQAPAVSPKKLVSRVTLVNTPVTVRDARGQMVTSLAAKDFRITDQGVPQTISHFDVGGDPISLVVLYETSSRIEPLLPALQKTGILISETVMGPTGEAAILGFNDSVDHLLDFTNNADQVQKTAACLKLGTSGAKLYDAMATGVEMLSTRPEAAVSRSAPDTPDRHAREGRRRVLLVISEARDDGSEAKLGEVLRQAQLSNVTIYSVGLSTTRAELQQKPQDNRVKISPPGTYPLPPIPGTPPRPAESDPRLSGNADLMAAIIWAVSHAKNEVTGNPLELATAGTGGEHIPTFKDRSIENAIDEIGGELHSQYTLSYSPAGTSENGFHEIKVSVDRKGLKVRARPGYYLAPPEG